MYNTSQAFKDAVYGISRKTLGRVTFDITDVTAYSDVLAVTSSSTAATALSNPSQVVDRKRSQDNKLVTGETDRVLLDGSFSFSDDVNVPSNGELGWASGSLCDASGVFSTAPQITIMFNGVHSSAGLTVTFDFLGGEYATDYVITAYNASNGVIATVSVTGNTEVIDQPLGQLLNYKKVVITVQKWSKPNRRARITEVDFGIVRVYDQNSLVSMALTEELDLATASIPSAEFSFGTDNSDRAFNILNPSGFYKYLQQRQKITGEIGVELTPGGAVEYVPLGLYYLSEWTSDEGSLTASFKARTALDLMSGYDYEQLTANSRSLYALAQALFTTCGITDYVLDASLSSITTNSMSSKINCKDALQRVAIAGCCNITVSRTGSIVLEVVAAVSTPVDSITFDNTYAEPQIILDKVVKSVEVSYFTTTSGAVGSAISNVSGVTDGDALKVDNNTFINTSARAQVVADWVKTMRGNRARSTINWRGNPSHELGDSVSLDNSYGVPQTALITKNNITFQGYLAANTEAKGVPN